MPDPSFNENIIRGKMRRARDKRGLLSGGKAAEGEVLGSGPANRHGMPKLPPGQREVPNWPVLDLGIQPDIPLDKWRLEVKGEVGQPYVLNWKDFLAMPQVEDVSDFHCVTTWSRMDNRWKGVPFRMMAEKAKLKPSARFVYFTAYDGYSTNLKLAEAMDEDVLLVHAWEGRPLPKEHGGPVRVITPRKYAWKGSKWVKEIIFLPQDQMGFWEARGYSNTAEPWDEDRYAEPHPG
ncbi:MAG: sulfite oxidase-like oxidoreductase [Candidatus Omnitrophota bacterium]|nr:sulfite oxidase-like oxidoreductase [Candidatus Omnitrophota bacterium]MDZ4242635.1 sulfite oxidase-like oxidoreductase [Candidatus Omnitrophota bacterium]